MKQKNELLTLMESEDVIETIEKLKKELLQFLNFDELTGDILHRLTNRIEVKRTVHRLFIIDLPHQKLNREKPYLASFFHFCVFKK